MLYLYRLRTLLRPYTLQIIGNLILLLSMTGLSLVVPRIIQGVVDDGLTSGKVAYIIQSAILLLLLGLFSSLLGVIQRYLSQWIAAHVGYDLRNRLYDHIQYMTFTFHDHAQTGQLISRCIEDVRAVHEFVGGGMIEWIQLILLLGGIIGLMLADNWQLALISLLPMIPLLWVAFDFGRKITIMFYKVDSSLGDLSARLQENISGVQVVRAFAREPYEISRFDVANRDYFEARLKVVSTWATIMPTSTWLVTMGTILILWFGGEMVLAGKITVGQVVAFNAYLLMMAAPAQQLTGLVNAGGEAIAGAKRAWEILDDTPSIQSPMNPQKLEAIRGEVEFCDVSLKYQDELKDSLAGVNIHIEPNQLVALIGSTGSGKTSLINLIPRFYDVTAGSVLVDGVDVRNIDLTQLRRQIGIVLQSSMLFSDSIFENIRYGRPEASSEEVLAAAKAAQAHEFILELPQGYETVVGERGITLSGGQRQRVAIARALLMNPRILILDDSLSSVDTQTEKLIQAALDQLMVGRTTFIIAHRLSTVKRANIILVMDDGQIVQHGTHEELLKQGGLYKAIHDMQLNAEGPLLAGVDSSLSEITSTPAIDSTEEVSPEGEEE